MDFGKIFGKIDPMAAIMTALGLVGGPQQQQFKKSFRQPGQITDPKESLYHALQATYRAGQGLSEKTPTRLRSSVVPQGPSPITIPGLGFQIGGGMGHDPALDDPTILDTRPTSEGVGKYDPFQSIGLPPDEVKRRTSGGV